MFLICEKNTPYKEYSKYKLNVPLVRDVRHICLFVEPAVSVARTETIQAIHTYMFLYKNGSNKWIVKKFY